MSAGIFFDAANPILITGCYRSGTTLVEKLLNGHPQVAVASQPFPVLYTFLKQKFFAERGLCRRYPLGHMFLETGYGQEEFYSFLDHYVMSSADVRSFFDQLDEYTNGLWTPELREARPLVHGGTFWQIYLQLMQFLDMRFPRRELLYRGTKEVLIEEYAPYFLRKGAAVVFVIRDPRGMIASLNFRERDNLTGENRPILFSLRLWRKSVAFALAAVEQEKTVVVRHEDVVGNPGETLGWMAETLGIAKFEDTAFDNGIKDQYGYPWRGNSSFSEHRGISEESILSWEKRLPLPVVAYIETVCQPEMRLLGYTPVLCRDFDPSVVREYRDPFRRIHSKFPADYSCNPNRVNNEILRMERLSTDLTDASQLEWFVTRKAHQILRSYSNGFESLASVESVVNSGTKVAR